MPHTCVHESVPFGSFRPTSLSAWCWLLLGSGIGLLPCGGHPAHAQQPLQPLPAVEPAEPAATSQQIVEVRIEGNETVEISKLPQLTTRAGQLFDSQSIEEDVRTLHRSGKFIDVLPKYVRVRQGVVVIFEVSARAWIVGTSLRRCHGMWQPANTTMHIDRQTERTRIIDDCTPETSVRQAGKEGRS